MLAFCVSPLGQADALDEIYGAEIRPLLDQFCFECHADEDAEADIDLDSFKSVADIRRNTKVWLKVDDMLSSRQMPPKKSDQPSDAQRGKLQNWVHSFLLEEAKARAGDPGRVALRRLNNDEYNYSVRDLTGVASLNPTREFPIDGAAGEGFTNAGDALVMSPALVGKFLDAGKEVARHAVLLPDGIRFSEHITERDRADALMAQIQNFYAQYVAVRSNTGDNWDDSAEAKANVINRNGSIPLEPYFAATLEERDALAKGGKSLTAVAKSRGLNANYLGKLWAMLTQANAPDDSFLLNDIRKQWQATTDGNPKPIVEKIQKWQQALWRFDPIGHIGRAGGPTAWMNPQAITRSTENVRLELSPPADGSDVVVYLAANDAGDGSANDFVRWRNPRLVGGGKADFSLRNVPGLARRLAKLRREALAKTAEFLAAAAEVTGGEPDVEALAKRHELDVAALAAWLDYLALGPGGPVKVEGMFAQKLLKGGGYDFVNGWGTSDTPSVTGNSSDTEVRVPGLARPHSLMVHPSPTVFAAVGWQSPVDGVVSVSAKIADAHPECGNGIEWWVQHRTIRKVGNLGNGTVDRGGSAQMPVTTVAVRKGELISIVVGPKEGNHVCDLTHIDMTLTETGGAKREWDAAREISGNILEGNPLKDSHGHGGVWHFYHGEVAAVNELPGRLMTVPAGSLLARWQMVGADDRAGLAKRIGALATGSETAKPGTPDALLLQHLQRLSTPRSYASALKSVTPDKRFGRHPLGHAADAADLIVKAPAVVGLRIPAALAEGRTLVTTGELEPEHGQQGSAQLAAALTKPALGELSPERPIVVAAGSAAEKRLAAGLEEFRDLFPASICYPKIVPVDEVVTLALYFREDHHLQRLMLDEAQKGELDRLWDELLYITKEPLKAEVAYEQIVEFSTQDRPDLVIAWKPYREPLMKKVAAFRERLKADEPGQLDGVLEFAGRAWRRTLTGGDREGLRALYRRLREREIPHEKAIQLTIARVLTSPAFLYKREQAGAGAEAKAVSGAELATRLSYFLWSSLPDAALGQAASSGELTNDDALLAQTRRMLRDARTRRLAEQFACQWLHIRGFDKNDDKNVKLYPEFPELRGAMYEESVRFFEDMFRNDGSVLGLLNADHTFLNERLARHYGIGGVSGDEWRRVGGVRAKGRGGVLGLATVLAANSGASRTSPILRGNWIYETLLGERLPRPPANVPNLKDSVPEGLTARELIEEHSSTPGCAKCHKLIDPYGFALEQYDAIGRLRPKPVDTKTKLVDGTAVEGIDGLRHHLATDRRDDVLEQFCRKLLGYALGREVALSDLLLLEEMQKRLKASDFRFSVAVETIVTSEQFRNIRGRLAKNED
jgi:uncharacterized protein YndB with AHSA1/START domain